MPFLQATRCAFLPERALQLRACARLLQAKQDALERALQKSQKVIYKIDYNLG